MTRIHRTLVVAAAAGLALLPAAASAQTFPLYPNDKFLGNANDFTTSTFPRYFNQLIPENAGKWGSAAGTTRTAAMRWTALDQAYAFAKTNNVKFNFHILLWGNQQPTWMTDLPPDEQLVEIKKWFAAVAARYPDIDVLQVVNEGTWDPPDGSTPKNAGANFSSSGNYVQALGGYNGTDGTGYDWILNGFRLARQYFPNTKLMLNDVAITGMTAATDEYLKIINILKRENLIDVIGLQAHAFEFIPGVTNAPAIPGHPYVPVDDMRIHKANLDRLAATGLPIDITELDLDGLPVNGVAGDEMQLRYYRNVVPTFWEHPAVRGITLWGWKAPNHWRNAQNAPIALSSGTLKPAGAWLFDYVNGIAPVIRPDQSFTIGDGNENRVGTVIADDWASKLNRPELRTFTWRITGGTGEGIFAFEPDHRRAARGQPAAARREHDLLAEGARQRRLPREHRDRRHGDHRGARERRRRQRRRDRPRDARAHARRVRELRRVHARRRARLRVQRERQRDQHRGRRDAERRRSGRVARPVGQWGVLPGAAGAGAGVGGVRAGRSGAGHAAFLQRTGQQRPADHPLQAEHRRV